MARYRKIDPRIWNDEKFRLLKKDCKLIAFYVLTGQSNRIGIFKFSVGMAAEELCMETPLEDGYSYPIAMRYVCDTLKWEWDEQGRVVYLPTWWKYNRPENPKHLIGCLKDLSELPQSVLVSAFMDNMEYLPDSCHDAMKRVCDSYRHSYGDRYAISGTGAGAVTETGAGAGEQNQQADSVNLDPVDNHLKHWLGLSKYKYEMGRKMPYIRTDIRADCENYPDDEITKAIEAVGAGCYSWLKIREQLEKQAKEIYRVEHQFDRADATKEKLRKHRAYLQKRVDDEKAGKAEEGAQ